MTLLASPLSELKSFYDVLVIGSGYGGSIAASLLARAKQADGTAVRVCLLERGKEIPVGAFPNTPEQAVPEFQVSAEGKQVGHEDALYWLHAGPDISVFQGCGLGGTSLVNANVALPPEARVWEDPRWPAELRRDLNEGVKAGLTRAKQMLAASPYPGNPEPKKYSALRRSAERLDAIQQTYYPDITVNFEERVNHVGIKQKACDNCGDCVSGCNVGAKNTLMMNYLPDAKNHGAEIYCSVRVQRVSQTAAGWRVYYSPVGFHRDRFQAEDLFVDAGTVIVSAGALGSTEILLRSKESGLLCSERLGESFSGNGDVLGFAYNTDHEVGGIGNGKRLIERAQAPGPCITGIIDCRNTARIEDAHVIEEGVIPGAIAPLLTGPMRLVADLTGTDTDTGVWDEIRETARVWSSELPGGEYRGAFENTQTFLVMSHDTAAGKLSLNGSGVSVSWPQVGQSAHFQRMHERLTTATAALGGTYVPSPTFNKAFGYDLVTVHPLGGCSMGEDATRGVTNHKGQVFSGAGGTEVYSTLYVSDGAILPCSVGVNPLLTISALAERNTRLLARERNWRIDDTLASAPAKFDGKPLASSQTRLRFTEKMAGHCSTSVLGPEQYQEALTDGVAKASPCQFVLTIVTDDAEKMIQDPQHPAAIVGTVAVPALSREAMTVREGAFNLFVADEGTPGLKRMRYRMRLSSVEGETFYFDGFKLIRHDALLDVWGDTTTLYVTIYRGSDELAPKACQGILHIGEADFAVQMTTIDARDMRGVPAPLTAVQFGKLFASSLWDTYGPLTSLH